MTIDEKLRNIVARQASPQAADFRKAKVGLRRAMIEAQMVVGAGAPWNEADDTMLDAVSQWLVELADANQRGDGVPPSTRALSLPRATPMRTPDNVA